MNQRKLQYEIMRAILRSSSLEYDDAFQLVIRVSPQIAQAVALLELEKVKKLEKENELKKNRARSV